MDPEIEAMSTVATALGDLDDEMRTRVLTWAFARYGVDAPRADNGRLTENTPEQPPPLRPVGSVREPQFSDFVDLFDAVDPKTDNDKCLTAAYWVQVVEEQSSWQSNRLNNLLKDTGHGLSNVTATLRTAQNHKPAYVRQMAKNGKAQQAWKTYKLTTTGVSHIREKLGLSGSPSDIPSDDEG